MDHARVEGPGWAQVLTAALDRSGGRLIASPDQWRVLRALQACRTPALGGHWFRCDRCMRDHFVPHSCGNRHSPQCQGAAAAKWLTAQEALLLPIPYFHLVFTLPHSLNGLIRQNRAALYGLLFKAVSETLLQFGRERFQAELGLTAVLHTWGQSLIDHYHLHCIVTGGGWNAQNKSWTNSGGRYLFPVRALSAVFRGKYLSGLEQLRRKGRLQFHGDLTPLKDEPKFKELLKRAARPSWVVYSKRPFAGPEQVLRYLGRYTHRVALSPRRLRTLDPAAGTIRFEYKDYADGGLRKTMTLKLEEFLRRFLLHVLPPRFSKIRHYGLLANRGRQQRIVEVQRTLGTEPVNSDEASPKTAETNLPESKPLPCPHCRIGQLVWTRTIPRPRRNPVIPTDSS